MLGASLAVSDWSVVVVSPHAGATLLLLRVQYGTVSMVETASTAPPFTGTVMVVLAIIDSFILSDVRPEERGFFSACGGTSKSFLEERRFWRFLSLTVFITEESQSRESSVWS